MEMFVEGRIVSFFVVTFGVIFVWFGVHVLYNVITATGKVDYCYIDRGHNAYEVIGHRSWRANVHLGTANSPESANEFLKNSVLCK